MLILIRNYIWIVLSVFMFARLCGQDDPKRWANEVMEISSKNAKADFSEVIIFTGSSSIRFWGDLDIRFPKVNILNTGFGGSAMHELNFWSGILILQYKPKKVFIYEGDNDVSAGLSPEFVRQHAAELVLKIKTQNPEVTIYFISPKPSPSRWHLKEEYFAMNNALKNFCDENERVTYVDVWPHMLNENGLPIESIFIEDNLHMNKKGYDIWEKVIRPFLEE